MERIRVWLDESSNLHYRHKPNDTCSFDLNILFHLLALNIILGILLSFALLPYIVFGEFDHGRKFYQAIFAIMIWLALMITLIVLFYNPNPLYLEWAHRFTCVPPIGEAEGKARCPKPSDEVSHFKVFSRVISR